MPIEVPDRFWEFSEIESEQGGEDAINDVTRQISVGKHIEVTHQSICNESSSSARWSHCAENNQIFQSHEQQRLTIVPSLVVKVLSDQFKRRLSAICFFFRHIEIIDKDNTFLTDWRPIVSFSSLLHFAVDGILGLVSTGLS